MDRLAVNDMAMEAYIMSLRLTGYGEEAERVQKDYEVQRVEIMSNTESAKEIIDEMNDNLNR